MVVTFLSGPGRCASPLAHTVTVTAVTPSPGVVLTKEEVLEGRLLIPVERTVPPGNLPTPPTPAGTTRYAGTDAGMNIIVLKTSTERPGADTYVVVPVMSSHPTPCMTGRSIGLPAPVYRVVKKPPAASAASTAVLTVGPSPPDSKASSHASTVPAGHGNLNAPLTSPL